MPTILTISIVIVATLATRLFLIVYHTKMAFRPPTKPQNQKANLLVVLGSGGHTGEMLALMSKLNMSKYNSITFVHGIGDTLSLSRVKTYCSSRIIPSQTKVHLVGVKRARSVHQTWLSSIYTSTVCLAQCFQVVYAAQPDLVLCNGPAICVMVAYAALALKVLGLSHSRIMYVESLARVSALSLSGKLLHPICDRFIVQWPQLAEKLNCECHGILV